MNKTFKLLKANFRDDVNIFKNKAKGKFAPYLLALVLMLTMGTLAYVMGEELHKVGLTFFVLTEFITIVTVLSFIQTIFKSQSMLFDCKDNDLLMSLPITKRSILFVRMFKMTFYQIQYCLIFLLPSVVIYAWFEHPGLSFYLLSLLMFILIPLIPITVGILFGYIVKGISSRFKFKKIIQSILSIGVFFLIYYLTSSMESFVEHIAEKATSINDLITGIYFPLGAYLELIEKFDIITFIEFILVNVIPFIVLIYIGSISYFKIISNSKGVSNTKKVSIKDNSYKSNSKMISLIKKEFNKYFQTPVYMFNTFIGLALMLLLAVFLFIKGESGVISLLSFEGIEGADLNSAVKYIPIVYLGFILFSISMTSITSSALSLEKKAFNLTKTLPISYKQIIWSKILFSIILMYFCLFISDLLMFIKFEYSVVEIIFTVILSIFLPVLVSAYGLIANLIYPKLNANNDIEVVKQSSSSMMGVLGGMIFTSMLLVACFFSPFSLNTTICLALLLIVVLTVIVSILVNKIGEKKIKELYV